MTARLRKGQQPDNVNAKVVHNGPQVDPQNRDKFTGRDNLGFRSVSAPWRWTWQTFFFAPWNSERGSLPDSSPSLGTTFVSLFLTFLSSLVYGWAYGTVLDQTIAAGIAIPQVEGGIIFAFVSGFAYILTKGWTWEPTLPTYVNWNILFASVGTFDIGLLPFLLVTVFMLGGYAAAGGIIGALGVSSAGPTFFAPVITSKGAWLYWFLGTVITFNFIFLRKWVPKNREEYTKRPETFTNPLAEIRENFYNTEDSYAHMRRVIMYTGLAIFIATVGFRNQNLYYFDAGMWITTWAATHVSNVVASPVLDWAFFWFVPLAQAAAALLLYYLILALWWWSYQADDGQFKKVQARMYAENVRAKPLKKQQDLNIFHQA